MNLIIIYTIFNYENPYGYLANKLKTFDKEELIKIYKFINDTKSFSGYPRVREARVPKFINWQNLEKFLNIEFESRKINIIRELWNEWVVTDDPEINELNIPIGDDPETILTFDDLFIGNQFYVLIRDQPVRFTIFDFLVVSADNSLSPFGSFVINLKLQGPSGYRGVTTSDGEFMNIQYHNRQTRRWSEYEPAGWSFSRITFYKIHRLISKEDQMSDT